MNTLHTLRALRALYSLYALRALWALQSLITLVTFLALCACYTGITFVTFRALQGKFANVKPIISRMCSVCPRPNIQRIWRALTNGICITVFALIFCRIRKIDNAFNLSHYFDAKLVECALLFEHKQYVILVLLDLFLQIAQFLVVYHNHLALSPFLDLRFLFAF